VSVLGDLVVLATLLSASTRGTPSQAPPRADETSLIADQTSLRSGDGAAAQQADAKPPSGAEAARAVEDERAKRAWATLSGTEKRDAIDYFALEAGKLDTLQASLVRFVLQAQDRDFGLWPAAGPVPAFSSKEHTPENDVPRHELGADSAAVRDFRKIVFKRVPERRLRSSWTYDYATRELRRAGNWKDPDALFANALAGFPPQYDLVEALVERELDDGSEQKALAAFGHAYTDRNGGVYTGITLYDAWTSHAEIEMPDVDSLGIVHTVLGDWKTWKAPVAAGQQEALYQRIGDVYTDAHRHRSLRCAIARCYACGSAVLRDQYDLHVDTFHALWDEAHSTPAELRDKLPKPADWADFLDASFKRLQADDALSKRAADRRLTLDRNAGTVRSLMLRVLDEFGAFARLEHPAAATQGKTSR
jgi:hypothetical protein